MSVGIFMGQTRFAIKAAKKAGDFLLKRFKKRHEIESKGRHDFVTEADKESERIIIKYLMRKCPEYSFLAEESGFRNSKDSLYSHYRWIIDPLDGTVNYMLGIPFFDVAIGLVLRDKIIKSVVYAPVTDELFVAELYKGSSKNDMKMYVSGKKEIEGSLMVFCHSNTSKEIKRNIRIYQQLKMYPAVFNQPRAGNLEMAYLADGRIDAFVNNGAKTWDSVCGALLVRESGGLVTDFSGNAWSIKSRDLLASNGLFHNRLLKLVRGV